MQPRGLTLLICLLIAACAGDGQPSDAVSSVTIGHTELNETSGLARSHRVAGRFWAHNDSGDAAKLYAFGADGVPHGSVRISGAVNVDWEDMVSFEQDGRPWLLIGDIGDNAAMRPVVTLYLVEEPDLQSDAETRVGVHRRLRFRYPDGSRDAESLAVDLANAEVLVLTKRDIPAVLYGVALEHHDNDIQTATRHGDVATITQPTTDDIARAPKAMDWFWQPTAMDIAGERMAILTYRGIFVFERAPASTWVDALQKNPRVLNLGDAGIAEAIAFDASGDRLFVTVERPFAPLIQFEL